MCVPGEQDLRLAESELLNQGKVDECIDMYQKLFKHDEAIRVAEQARHPEVPGQAVAWYAGHSPSQLLFVRRR